MSEATATTPKVERVTFPWTVFKGLPELPRDRHMLPVSVLRPTIPVLFRGPGGEIEKDCLLDTGTDSSVFRTEIAHAIGLKPSDCTVSAIEFMGGDGPEPLWGYPPRFTGTLAGTWEVKLPGSFKDYPPHFFEAGLLGRDVLNAFRVVYDGPARATTLEREGSR